MHRSVLVLLAILGIATFVRLSHLGSIPSGVNRDEASIGFTAYSLQKTGSDEYGKRWPISFQSFGDWKLPLYIYATLPFVATLGMSELSVRIVSALSGIATVAITFFLVQALFSDKRLALLSALLVAIAPWDIHLSRVESESNLAVLLVSTGLLLILQGSRQKPWKMIVGFVCLALTYYTYHGNHVSTTLILIGFGWLYWNQLKQTRAFQIGLILFLLLVGVIVGGTFTQADSTKFAGISIFGDPTVVHEKIELPRANHPNPNALIVRLMHNRLTFAFETFVQNYLKSFSSQFLFISGGTNHAHNIANFGNMYLVEAPLLLLGIVMCLLNRKRKPYRFLLWWLLVSPVAASITKDAPHSNRMFAIFPALEVVVAMGILYLRDELIPNRYKKIATVILILFYLTNVALYIDRYFIHFPVEEVANWGKGYKALTQELSRPLWTDKSVVLANPQESPYIFLLFYGRMDPAVYQKNVARYQPTDDGFYHVLSFGRFIFRPIDWDKDSFLPHTLLIDYLDRIPTAYRARALTVDQFGIVPTSE